MPLSQTYANDILETSQTLGTITYVLDGEQEGYRPFSSEFDTGDTPFYVTRNAAETQTEFNKGPSAVFTDSDPCTLARDVYYSTNSNNPVNWQTSDLPLSIYIPTPAEVLEIAVKMGLSTIRNAFLEYGMWAKEDGHAANYDQIRMFDNVDEDVIGVVNRVNHHTTLYGWPPGYKSGLILSRPSTTTLAVSAGGAMDSTDSVAMRLTTSRTKSTAGSWVTGAGQNAMGDGLTIANSTWYHVFLILNAGVVDFYFDTSVSAANKPTGTTHWEYLGSFKTNGSAQIIDFLQVDDCFYWATAPTDYSNGSPSGSLSITYTVPTGRNVFAMIGCSGANSAGLTFQVTFTDSGSARTNTFYVGAGGTSTNVFTADQFETRTSTSAQSGSVTANGTSGATFAVQTFGWRDPNLRRR